MVKTKVFDIYDHLKTEKDIKDYLKAAFEMAEIEQDSGYISEAVGIVAKARGMLDTAKKAGVSRENLYRSLSKNGNPELKTIMKVVNSFGLKLTIS
jgi:probable addiction module antidote protein